MPDVLPELDDRALVLEVGSGSNPWWRSDVLLDRYYVDESGQRGGAEIFRDRRPMIVAAGERLPFKDKAFDFAYCCHVIEHAEDIASMLREMSRVAEAGFIECPNPLLEKILNQKQHNWYITNVDGKLLIARKQPHTNVTTREDCFYFRMMSDHFIVRHNWERFVTRLQWSGSIAFEVVDDVSRVFAQQRIDEQLDETVRTRLLEVLFRAWRDAVIDRIFRFASSSAGATTLRSALCSFRKWRRNRSAPRISAESFLGLLACPDCRSDLLRGKHEYTCVACQRRFPDSDGVSVLL